MPDVSRRSITGLVGASITASQLPLAFSGCSSVFSSTDPDRVQGWYIDGLYLLPADLNDIRASKIDAFICDIPAIEHVVWTGPDLMRCYFQQAERSICAQ